MALINCIVVTPEATAVEAKADFVVLPLYDGEIGIAPGRAPLIGRLGFGEMRVKLGDKVARYYVDGGFVQVAANVVSILTNRAIPAAAVDAKAAQQQLQEAMKLSIVTDDLEQIRDRSVTQARAQIRVAGKS